MPIPVDDIDGCRLAHVHLARTIGDLSETNGRQPSALPGWSIAHVLAHLSLNAEAMCRRIEAATEGLEIEQYPGGPTGRAAMIEDAAKQPMRELVAAALQSAALLDECFASLPPQIWDVEVRTVAGTTHPISALPFRRWREVEVHLVDMGLGATPNDWPQGLVDQALPRLVASLTERCDNREFMAWALGRGDAPILDTWGETHPESMVVDQARGHRAPE